jgi:3-hydroxyisobutyrate dehydrogenase
MVAFLGTGLMGSGFVRAMRARGEAVAVWNRTGARAQALEKDGAVAFPEPAEAVRGATRVHLSLSDDASVDAALERARPGLAPGAILLDHTTTAPGPTRERALRWNRDGFTFVHAPVFMGPANARDATGLMLVSGSPERVASVRGVLEKMTGRLLVVGEAEERAAAFKLLGNLMIVFIASGLADTFALGKAMGISAADAHGLFQHFNPANQISLRGKRMAEGDFAPSFELQMARKDVRLMLESAGVDGGLQVLPAIAAMMDRVIAEGHGAEDLAVIAHRSVR